MGIDKSKDTEEPTPETAADRQLREDGLLGGAENRAAVDHVEYEKSRNPDTQLRLDGEKDSLYDDGLDVEDDTDTLAGTRGNSPASGFKP